MFIYWCTVSKSTKNDSNVAFHPWVWSGCNLQGLEDTHFHATSSTVINTCGSQRRQGRRRRRTHNAKPQAPRRLNTEKASGTLNDAQMRL